jgi:hypothetical protein
MSLGLAFHFVQLVCFNGHRFAMSRNFFTLVHALSLPNRLITQRISAPSFAALLHLVGMVLCCLLEAPTHWHVAHYEFQWEPVSRFHSLDYRMTSLCTIS